MLSPPSRPRSRWRRLLRPTWLAWHAFAVLAAAGMLWLGDWQLRRAEAGNELSWAYTFEWPLFAVLGAVFWVKTVREELRAPGAGRLGSGRATTPASTTPANTMPVTGGRRRPGRRWIGDGRCGCDRLCGPAAHARSAGTAGGTACGEAGRFRPPGGTARRGGTACREAVPAGGVSAGEAARRPAGRHCLPGGVPAGRSVRQEALPAGKRGRTGVAAGSGR